MIGHIQLHREGTQLIKAVAVAEEGESDVAPAFDVDDVVRNLHEDVDAVAWPHPPEEGHEVVVPIPQLGLRDSAPHEVRVRTAAHDGHVPHGATGPGAGDAAIRLIRSDHRVGGKIGAPFEPGEDPLDDAERSSPARAVELGTEIVVIEEELGAAAAQEPGEQPSRVRWVPSVQHGDRVAPVDAPDQERGADPRPDDGQQVTHDAARDSRRERQWRVAVQPARRPPPRRTVSPGALGTHRRHPEAVGDERLALQPHAPIQGQWHVLRHHDDVPSIAGRPSPCAPAHRLPPRGVVTGDLRVESVGAETEDGLIRPAAECEDRPACEAANDVAVADGRGRPAELVDDAGTPDAPHLAAYVPGRRRAR